MSGNHQSSPHDRPSQAFNGIHFVLYGFDPINKAKVSRKLVDGGGVDAGLYGPNCTHVIVDKLAHDDPICIAARLDGKILVSGLWVDHSSDVGMALDTTSVMYKPVKDLNGIPGARSLVICLTGYQRQDRDDIMTMVGLMGANFSKPLVATKVTHLICYKFEGEKYELAKKMKRIKLINHKWLEDCLKVWKILSEVDYDKSGYDLEMMEAEAKDSEEEAEGKTASPHHSLMLKKEVSENQLNTSASKGKNTSDRTPNPHEIISKVPGLSDTSNLRDVTSEPSNLFGGTISGSMKENNFDSTFKSANRSPHSQAEKFISTFYSRKTPRRTTPPTTETASNLSGSTANICDSFKTSSPMVEQEKDGRETALVGQTTPAVCHEEDSFSGKRKMEIPCGGSSKLHKKSYNKRALDGENPIMATAAEPLKPLFSEEPLLSPGNDDAPGLNETLSSEIALKGENGDALQISPKRISGEAVHAKHEAQELQNEMQTTTRISDIETFSTSPDLDIKDINAESNLKLVRRKSAGKKQFSAPKLNSGIRKTAKQKASLCLKSGTDASTPATEVQVPSDGEKLINVEKIEKVSPEAKSGTHIEMEMNDVLQFGNVAGNKSVGMDDETEPPEDKGEAGKGKAEGDIPEADQSEHRNSTTSMKEDKGEVETFDDVKNLVSEKTGRVKKRPLTKKAKRKAVPVMEEAAKKASGNKELAAAEENNKKLENKAGNTKKNGNENDLEKEVGGDLHENENITEHGNLASFRDKVEVETSAADDMENLVNKKVTRGKKRPLTKAKKSPFLSVKDIIDKTAVGKKLAKGTDIQHTKESGPSEKEKTIGNDTVNDSKSVENPKEKEIRVNDQSNSNDEKSARQVPMKNISKAGNTKKNGIGNDLEKEVGGDLHENEDRTEHGNLASFRDKVEVETSAAAADMENLVNKKVTRGKKRSLTKAKKSPFLSVKDVIDKTAVDKKLAKGTNIQHTKESGPSEKEKTIGNDTVNDLEKSVENPKEKKEICVNDQSNSSDEKSARQVPTKIISKAGKGSKTEPMWFILSGHKLQRREFQQVIRRLNGRVCRVSHQWSYQATHFIVPEPIRRTEKFFAAAASGSWILKMDYLSASNEAGRFLGEEPYEWYKNDLSEDGQINLEAPRKWRLLKQKTGHGAFYGMRIIIYGNCIAPPLDTVKRVVKAGDGRILATSPPYGRFLEGGGIDFAIVSPGIAREDVWVEEFLKHEIACVSVDYLVEYVCKPGHPLDKYVEYDTNAWAQKSYHNLKERLEEEEPMTPNANRDEEDVTCEVCGSGDRGDEMLICGDERGSTGCGVGIHIDCCQPPFQDVPQEDWFCPKCTKSTAPSTKRKTKAK